MHALHFNVQLCIQTPQLIKLCILKFIHICMYVVMYDIICLVGYYLLCHLNERIRWLPNSSQQSTHVRHYRRNPTKNVGKQNKCFLTRYTNLIHVPYTRGSSQSRQATATPSRSTTSDSLPTNPSAAGFSIKLWGIHSSRGVKSVVQCTPSFNKYHTS